MGYVIIFCEAVKNEHEIPPNDFLYPPWHQLLPASFFIIQISLKCAIWLVA